VNPALEISFVGYTQALHQVKGHSDLGGPVQQDTRALGDVVIVGYGEQRKRDVTGSISSVKAMRSPKDRW